MIYNLEKISKIRRPEMEVVLIFAILKKKCHPIFFKLCWNFTY